MKKIYMIALTLIACAFLASTDVVAQEFPWPDLGTPMVIEPGAPGVLDATINGDTAADGTRNHQHYILKRDAVYLYIFETINTGWDLMVTAEEGDGALPIIKALGTPQGGDEAMRPFVAQGNLYLQGLNMHGWANDGLPTDNATVRLNSDDITGVLKDCIFDYNRQNSLRLNGANISAYVENCLFYGQGTASKVSNGESVHFRGNPAKIVHLRNNTLVNNTDLFMDNRLTQEYDTFIADHNTMVNSGRRGAALGRPQNLTWTNNLIVNPMVLGDGSGGDRSRFLEPRWAFQLDSNFVETIVGSDTSYVFEAPNVTWNNNWIYVDPGVTAFLPDTSNGADLFMYHPLLEAAIEGDATNKVITEQFVFNSPEVTATADYQGFIDDYYTLPPTPRDLPGFNDNSNNNDPTTKDFGYSNTHAAFTGAADGKPLGDLNWHDLSGTGIADKLEQVNMKVFPNPVTDYFIIDLDDQEMTRVDILNVLGQSVYHLTIDSNTQAVVNATSLEKGIYFVSCYDNNRLISTHKITK